MAIAYTTKTELVLYAVRGELGPKKRNGFGAGVYWALTSFMALAETETDQYPVTEWHFRIEMKPAVERLMAAKKTILEYIKEEECEPRIKAIMTEATDTLNPEVLMQMQVDKEAGLL